MQGMNESIENEKRCEIGSNCCDAYQSELILHGRDLHRVARLRFEQLAQKEIALPFQLGLLVVNPNQSVTSTTKENERQDDGQYMKKTNSSDLECELALVLRPLQGQLLHVARADSGIIIGVELAHLRSAVGEGVTHLRSTC